MGFFFIFLSVFISISIAVKRYHDCDNSYKNISSVLLYIFRGFIYFHTGDDVQADMVVEKEMRVLHSDHQAV